MSNVLMFFGLFVCLMLVIAGRIVTGPLLASGLWGVGLLGGVLLTIKLFSRPRS